MAGRMTKITPGTIVITSRHKRPVVIKRVRKAGYIGHSLGTDPDKECRRDLIVYPGDIRAVQLNFPGVRP